MPNAYQIRADYDRDTIVLYQAYNAAIADAALAAQRFVAPFSFNRMTWLKPSFLWLMHRSNWGQKRGQERILAIRIKHAGWEEALAECVMTSPDQLGYSGAEWHRAFGAAHVHLQWDTERSIRGAAMDCYSIQVGLSCHIIDRYVNEWIVDIEDYTPKTRLMHKAISAGRIDVAKRKLPREKLYPLPTEIRRRIIPGTAHRGS